YAKSQVNLCFRGRRSLAPLTGRLTVVTSVGVKVVFTLVTRVRYQLPLNGPSATRREHRPRFVKRPRLARRGEGEADSRMARDARSEPSNSCDQLADSQGGQRQQALPRVTVQMEALNSADRAWQILMKLAKILGHSAS